MHTFPESSGSWRATAAAVLLLVLATAPLRADDAPAVAGPRDPAAEARALLQLADSTIQQSRYRQALEFLSRAYQIGHRLEDRELNKDVLNSMAGVYYSIGQLEQAHRYYSELVTLDEADANPASLAVSLFNLGHVNASLKRHAEANANFERSLALSRDLGDLSGTAYSLKALGVNAQARQNPADGRAYLLDALQRFRAIGDPVQAATTERHLGDIARENSQLQAAIAYYESALPVLAGAASDKALRRTFRGLSSAYAELGDYERAFTNYRAYAQLLRQHLEQQNLAATQRLQVQFDTQRLADNNERLEMRNQAQHLELRHRDSLLHMQYLVSGLALGIVVLVSLLWWRSRHHAGKMQLLATTDELTGLPNRRAILQHGVREWERSRRFGRPFCCLLFDVDKFKSINDSWGHAAGDLVLRAIAERVQSGLRSSDMIGRFGGEEFLLITPETELSEAASLAGRMRREIESIDHESLPGRSVTVSIGIAGAGAGSEVSLDEMIAHADQALYDAKTGGRNQVAIYRGDSADHAVEEEYQMGQGKAALRYA